MRRSPARLLVLAAALAGAVVPVRSSAQAAPGGASTGRAADSMPARRAADEWAERISLRGYVQVRYNRLLESNPRLVCTQCDRSLGGNGGIFVRRARFSVAARVSPRVLVVLQPDFTAETGEAIGVAQLRDLYAEVELDSAGAWRVRLGQTNVPFGWENLVSSANRVPLDRTDALNSAAPTERDLGVYVFWSPRAARERYRALTGDSGKGPGDVGVVSAGIYNGQGANRSEQNNSQHAALRLAYPLAVGGQVIEGVVQGYTGRYVVPSSQRSVDATGPAEFADRRAAASLVLYPRPLGLQAEWTVGTGPAADPEARAIRQHRLSGGYVQAMLRTRVAGRRVIPYVRAQRYDGGKKFETDARLHRVREVEAGAEWLAAPGVELTTAAMAGSRRTADLGSPVSDQRGHRVRLQVQLVF
jgi:hypothetical protein